MLKENTITISWTGFPGASYYGIEFGSAFTKVVPASSLSFTLTGADYPGGLYAGKQIQARVTALSSGYSTYAQSNIKTCYTSPEKVGQVFIDEWRTNSPVLELAWNKGNGYPDGYEICLLNAKGKVVKIVDVPGYSSYISYKFNGGSTVKGKGFALKVRSYFSTDGVKIYGAWSDEHRYVDVPKTKWSKSTSTLSWSKIAGAKSYTVYVNKKNSLASGFKKLKTVKGTKLQVSIPRWSTYRYYVVPNGVKVHGKVCKGQMYNQKTVMSITHTVKYY